MISNVSIGCMYEVTDLIVCYRIYSVTEMVISPCFYFNKSNHSVFLRNDIHLFPVETPVALTYSISTRHQIGSCAIFAYSTKFVMLCHKLSVYI